MDLFKEFKYRHYINMRLFLFISLFLSSAAFAGIPAFTKIDASFKKISSGDCSVPTGLCEVKNMPRITSQDGLGICYAHVAATMMQAENCRVLKQDCANLPDNELFSPLDLTRLTRPKDGSMPSGARASYRGLKLESGNNDDDAGGDPNDTTMIAALLTKKTANESCLSLDKILSKMNARGETEAAQAAMWDRLKKSYFDYQKNKSCASCLSQIYATAVDNINENLNLKASNDEILKAFAQDSYEKFLDDLLGGSKCNDSSQLAFFENARNVKYDAFPEPNEKDRSKPKEPVTPDAFKNKVKEVLKTGRPVSLGNVCIGSEDARMCKPQNHHAVVIAGYRQVCNSAGACRDAFKVVNSWGKSWQDQNDGGWVDANNLIEHTKMQPYVLGWFADKK